MWNFPRNSPLILATALRLLSYFAPTAPPLNQVNTRIPPQGEAGCGRLTMLPHSRSLALETNTLRTKLEFMHSLFRYSLFWKASTYELELKTALRAVAVVRSSGNTQPAAFVLVILSVQHVPFFAAFLDLFLLRGDAFADFQLDLF